MTNWTKLTYPECGDIVWVADPYGDVMLAYWDGDSWKEPDGSSMYHAVVGWAEIDYVAVKQDWARS